MAPAPAHAERTNDRLDRPTKLRRSRVPDCQHQPASKMASKNCQTPRHTTSMRMVNCAAIRFPPKSMALVPVLEVLGVAGFRDRCERGGGGKGFSASSPGHNPGSGAKREGVALDRLVGVRSPLVVSHPRVVVVEEHLPHQLTVAVDAIFLDAP